MIQINDEILNKFIDGELSPEEVEEVKMQIESSEKIKEQFNALKLINSHLRNIKEDEVSPNFTSSVMFRINYELKVKKSDKKFIAAMFTIILGLCLSIIGFVAFNVFETISRTANGKTFGNFVGIMEGFLSLIKHVFSPQNLSLTGSIVSLGIIITAYFFFESRKKTNFNTR